MSAPQAPPPRNFAAWLRQPLPTPSPSLPPTDARLPVLIIGAGPAGLAAMSSFQRAHIPFTAVDSAPDVGGLWSPSNPSSPAYSSLITNSSKYTTHISGTSFRPPSSLPNHLPRQAAADYLRRFADDLQLRPHILLSTTVTRLRKSEATGTWLATQESEGKATEAEYRAVVIAVGPQSRTTARVPADLAATANAAGIPWVHSAEYRVPAPYHGKRVLVVGLGNSGSEIATEVSAVAVRCLVSVRTTPWIVPLSIAGIPGDVVANMSKGLPHWLQMRSLHFLQRLYIGHPTSLGFRPPNHDLLDRLPVMDRGIVAALRSKRVLIRGNVTEMAPGGTVRFDNGEAETVDAVVFATGWERKYPFLGVEYGEMEDAAFRLTLTILHPREAGLMFMPEIVVPQGVWPNYEAQARALTAYLLADARGGARLAELNARRQSPSPDTKGRLFKAAPDAYYADPRIYHRLMSDFTDWISGP